ncbi:MAG: PaaI family thioesterase [Pseudomonadota bacterium]
MSSINNSKAEELTKLADQSVTENASTFLGFKLLSVDQDSNSLRVEFNPGQAATNPAGSIQGGMITAMLDDAMCSAVWLLTDGKMIPLSVDIHMQFWRPAAVGRYTAEASVKHMTKSTAFLDGTLFNEANEAVAHGVQTVRLVPKSSRES